MPQTIVWKGSFASADEIENPEYLWAYYNTTDGCSYIYDGEKWTLLASSGKNGLDGKDGTNGKDGLDGKDGTNGKDGLDGKNGTDGKNGLDSKNGIDGTDGVNARVVILYVLNGGTLPEDAPLIYTYGSKTPLKLIAPQKSRFNFAGFYYNSDFTGPKVTELDDTYAYGQVLFAKWCYTVTLNYNDGREATTEIIDSANGYTPATLVRNGYTFGGWYTDEHFTEESKISCLSHEYGNVDLYALWKNDKFSSLTVLPAGTDGTAGPDWTYVEFGMWPQTIKQDGITVDESIKMERSGITYYMGSDREWYAKVTENPRSANSVYSDGTPVSEGTITYFKVEPIKWRVLTNEYSDYATSGFPKRSLLLAENILTAMKYFNSHLKRQNTIYPNDYETSMVRAWLDGCEFINKNGGSDTTYQYKGFSDIAFDEEGRHLIGCGIKRYKDGSSSSILCCSAFLLSPSEVKNESYGFTAFDVVCEARNLTPTDYAIANNASSSWVLRNEEFPIGYEDNDGKLTEDAIRITEASGVSVRVNYIEGVVPAITIDLSEYY